MEFPASSDIPKPWRPAWTLIAFISVVGGSAVGGVMLLDSRIGTRVDEVVDRKWSSAYQEAALKACTAAADAGAYRAVSEAMQQTIIPMQRSIDAHLAAQQEHEKSDEKRFSRIEKRLGF